MWAAGGISLNDLAVAIILDFEHQSGITVTYQIDPALKSIITRGLVPLMSHHDALMYVAQAGTAIMWMDRFNVLHIKQSVADQPLNPMPYTEELTLSMQETYPKIATQNPYNYLFCQSIILWGIEWNQFNLQWYLSHHRVSDRLVRL